MDLPSLELTRTFGEVSFTHDQIGKAFTYAANQKAGLIITCWMGTASYQNNLEENSIRPFTIGRENRMFSGSPKGAEASAVIYTLIETAKVNGLSPMK
ncbi:IS66 family transposase [Lacrimispora indolis]|uniref:IS66 family transposase n=1 Tax=Lacrimispora indolis TaxID=69825 RepID=UPI00045EA3B3